MTTAKKPEPDGARRLALPVHRRRELVGYTDVDRKVPPYCQASDLTTGDVVAPGETVTVRVIDWRPNAFDTVNVTGQEPAAWKVQEGFLSVDSIAPSPWKSQAHEVGLPVDRIRECYRRSRHWR